MSGPTWNFSRRKFVESLVLTGLAVQVPWLQSCQAEQPELPENIQPFTESQFRDLRALLYVLFPDDGNGPGARELRADEYVLWVLKDQQADPEEIAFIVDHTQRFSKEVKEKYDSHFQHLSASEQEEVLLQFMDDTSWCTRWSGRLMTLILEALLLDPQYGVNTQEKGWEWLEHNPGYPRPKKENLYPQILDKR